MGIEFWEHAPTNRWYALRWGDGPEPEAVCGPLSKEMIKGILRSRNVAETVSGRIMWNLHNDGTVKLSKIASL